MIYSSSSDVGSVLELMLMLMRGGERWGGDVRRPTAVDRGVTSP